MKTTEQLNEELKSLKITHKYVFELEVPLDDEGEVKATIFLKKADRQTHAIVSKLLTRDDSSKAIVFLLKNNCIGGDDINLILNDDDAILACDRPLVYYLKTREASIKKN